MEPTLQTTASAIDAKAAAGDEFLAFRLAGRRFAVASAKVERVVRAAAVTPLPQAPAVVLGVVDVAGEIVPVMDMRSRLGSPPKELQPEDLFLFARSGERRIALVVDAIDDLVRIGAAQPLTVDTPHFRGVVRLPDGLLLIHDVDAFLDPTEKEQLDAALREALA